MNKTFIEVDYYQVSKHGLNAEGDIIMSHKNTDDGRVITALSDGLGSGIKAGVLATLTATMAIKFIESDIPVKRAAEIIMNTLPVCKERGISYATFTLVDIIPQVKTVRIMEYDNPPYVLIREQTLIDPIKEFTQIERKNKKTSPKKEAILQYSKFIARAGDRLVFFSDGVTQSGMGTILMPFGWGSANAQKFIVEYVKQNPDISARDLARCVVLEARKYDNYQPKDDISCCVIYFRNPRDLLVITGPPMRPENDKEFVNRFKSFNGKKIICGGTTAKIIARETGKKLKVILKNIDPNIPPESEMEGADLVTEGIITIGAVSTVLENGGKTEGMKKNTVTRLVDMLLNSDRITFCVGTKINEAHQDPNMPVELEIRRNAIKKIARLLEEKYLKEVHMEFY
ncbi:MAG: SpoIIE family protein phosphatase [Treponema sp.]|nr:SpoIIE family protein phosphatase [Treponema sp.]